MKKNVMMRIASVLLIAVLISTCGISGTYAKYVTFDDASDEARVATWGVEITPNGELFFVDYDGKDGGVQVAADSVYSSNGDNVVAPGTSGDLTPVAFVGAPEVEFNIAYASTLTLTGWEVDITNDGVDNPVEYCPIIITVDATKYYIGADLDGDSVVDINSVSDLQTKVKAAIDGYSNTYEPNTNLATGVAVPSVSWEWEFEQSTVPDQTDPKDTALGNKSTAPQISLAITTTVTQVN